MSIKYYTNWWQYSWRLDCKLLYWSEQLSRWMSDESRGSEMDVHEWQLWSEQLSRWMSDESWCSDMDVHEWQRCQTSFAFSYFLLFNATHATLDVYISDEDKDDTDKKRNFENFAHKFKASPGHPIRELRSQRPTTWGNRSYKWQGLVTRAYRCSPEISDVFAFVCICILLSFYHYISTFS